MARPGAGRRDRGVYPCDGHRAPMERSVQMFGKLSFRHIVGALLALSFIAGFAIYVLTGATTNKGTTGAIGAENASIERAEKASCSRYGTYASIATLRKEGLLTFKPVYNSV